MVKKETILKVVLIGAGGRGLKVYSDLIADMKEKYKIVAVAEPIESRRMAVKKTHNIPDEMCFDDWKPLFACGKIADVAIIATMDKQHFEPAMQAISLNYDILLEKPVSTDEKECLQIALRAKEKGVKVVVTHVLRYAPIFTTIKNIIKQGKLGDIISINHEECVGNLHQSHSFVRGNWGNSVRACDMLLAKSCHDMDILQWLIDKKCQKVQSFGSLRHFRRENAPQGAPEYCIEGCPHGETCLYNAVKLYLDDKENGWFRRASTKEAEPTDEMVEKAIRTTQYGKCVYKCDNDVVDHQVVNLLFEDDVTVTFTMCAFNKGGRYIHIMGTKGELHGTMENESIIRIRDFASDTVETLSLETEGGHGGGDKGILNTLYEYLQGTYKGYSVSDISTSVDNHLIVFAAEYSRRNQVVVDIEEYKKNLI